MNEKIFIENVKRGVTNGGTACGPVEGAINTSVKFKMKGVTKWLTYSDVLDIPEFYLTEEDIFDRLMEQDFADEEFLKLLQENRIHEFEGIIVDACTDIEDAIRECNSPNKDAAELLRYLVSVAKCDVKELDAYIEAGNGKFVDEIYVRGKHVIDFSNMDQYTIFKHRLFLESNIEHPDLYNVNDRNVLRQMQDNLEKAKLLSKEGYEEWKEKYINEQKSSLRNSSIITIPYSMDGKDGYFEIIREEELDVFLLWLEEYEYLFPSVSLSASRDAMDEELAIYISKNAVNLNWWWFHNKK